MKSVLAALIVTCFFIVTFFPVANISSEGVAYASVKKPPPQKVKSRRVKQKSVKPKKSSGSLGFRKKLKPKRKSLSNNLKLKNGQKVNLKPGTVKAFKNVDSVKSLLSKAKVKLTKSGRENSRLRAKNYNNPYKRGTSVLTRTTTKPEKFVRVFTKGKTAAQGKWLMRARDIRGLTPAQIKRKFALPHVPTHFVHVTVPQKTKVSIGIAGSQSYRKNGKTALGGGVQYELRPQYNRQNKSFNKIDLKVSKAIPIGKKVSERLKAR